MGACAALGAALHAGPGHGDTRTGCSPSTTVRVEVDPPSSRVEGTVVFAWDCSQDPVEELLLWLYPNRLRHPPPQLDAMNAYWIYPHHFTPGSLRIDRVTVDGSEPASAPEPVTLPGDHPLAGEEDVLVSVGLGAPRERVEVEVEFHVEVPDRYGLFGRARGGMLLASYYHPVCAARAPGRWDLSAPPRGGVTAAVTLPEGHDAIAGDVFVQDGATVTIHDDAAAFVPLAVYPRLHTTRATCAGATLVWHGLDPRPEPGDYDPDGGGMLGLSPSLPDIMAWDRPGYALSTACRAVHMLADQGHPLPQGTRVRIVEAPLRMQLASANAHFVAVSDRLFDVVPVRKAWKFHEIQVVRAVAGHLVQRALVRRTDPPAAVTTADFVASWVAERYARSFHGSEEDMRDILKYGAFIAAIDYFIYSPLVQFRESYFSTVAEKDWLRDEPWAFLNRLPRGKLFYEKLLDLLGAEAVSRVVEGVLEGEGSLTSLAAEQAGEDLCWFWSQWSVAYPSLNYRIAGVESHDDGRGGWTHEAHVERQGDTSIREPVTVRFVFEDGGHEDVVWNEAGGETTVRLTSPHELSRVIVDPEMRLFEDPALTKNHPRHDNFSRPRWRPPVFSTLALSSNLTELSGDVDVIFEMRPKFDVLDAIRFRLLLSTWGQGGSVWYSRGFGPKLDLDTASWHVGAVASGFHYAPEFGFAHTGDDGTTRWHGGTAATAGVYIGHDDRFYLFNPREGWSFRLNVSYSLGIDDPVHGRERSLRHAVNVATRAFGLWTPAGGHTLALYGGAGGTFGDAYRGQLGSLSSRAVLRGFDVDETFGRVRLYLCAEYRHVFTHALNWNVLHAASVFGIQGVLFAGAGTATRESSYRGLFAADRVFTEVGYGLRGIIGYFGAYPGVVALDLAVPLTPRHRPDRLPVAVRVAFSHVF